MPKNVNNSSAASRMIRNMRFSAAQNNVLGCYSAVLAVFQKISEKSGRGVVSPDYNTHPLKLGDFFLNKKNCVIFVSLFSIERENDRN